MAASRSKVCVRSFSIFSALRARPGYPPTIRYREDILPRVPRIQEDVDPQYPPIKPSTLVGNEEGRKARHDEWINSAIRHSGTASEMIYEIQKHQRSQHVIYPQVLQPGYTTLYREVTKTVVVNELPKNIESLLESDLVKTEADALSNHIKDIITTELHSTKKSEKLLPLKQEIDRTKALGQNLVRVVVSYLGLKYGHLANAMIDEKRPVQSFWESGERRLQFMGEPVSSVRTSEPLSKFVEPDDEICQQEVEEWPYDPKDLGIYPKHMNSVCFPGFKYRPGHLHPHTQMYGLPINKVQAIEEKIYPEMHENFGVISGFAWVNALAMYQHHCWFKDISHPRMAQVVLTDGNLFSFYCYQANTINLLDNPSPVKNVCFQNIMVPMFTDIKDGIMRDFNENALRLLVAFFMNPTVKQSESGNVPIGQEALQN